MVPWAHDPRFYVGDGREESLSASCEGSPVVKEGGKAVGLFRLSTSHETAYCVSVL